jgi:hypothetical protein
MSEDMVSPTIKTFTLLLDCIPSTIEAERQLLVHMKENKVAPDTEFCNMLIKKRSFRGDNARAKVSFSRTMKNMDEPGNTWVLVCSDKVGVWSCLFKYKSLIWF